ncbi:MAG: ActS/PrrB/RegB family redox-sensitive histidine kinase [Alphaproteobacteria bacterium]|nr:ActS/PrrB/RegB family redox-sensitive histidine kinase [Alphaproteobacteria bacterium]
MARLFDHASEAGEAVAGAAGVSLRLLHTIRWVAILGQAASLVTVHFGLGFHLPVAATLAVVAASALINVVNGLLRRTARRLSERDAALYLAYDILQLGLLLYLTGGLQNPFAILMVAPVTVAATILSRRSVIGLSALAISAVTVLAVVHWPLPWRGPPPVLPALYVFGIWTALVLSTVFIAAYAWSVASEARRMREAFAATQLALAREQRVSAVGALAAAAAHELGSPLGTIAVIAKELVRELPGDSPHAEDAALLLSQSERCRRILAELAQHPHPEGNSPYDRLPISALVEAAGAPYRASGIHVVYAKATNTGTEPEVARSPEIMHGLGNLIQNAIHFARREVNVAVAWDRAGVAVEIADDGPGFPPGLLPRLGQPYLSGRSGEAQHMGLGIFIAQTLLARTGAGVDFANLAEGGAHVAVRWPRAALEAAATAQPYNEAVT